MTPINVEIVAYAPTGFYHCTHCEIIFKEQGIGDRIHSEQLQSAMPEDMLRRTRNYQAGSTRWSIATVTESPSS